MRRDWEGFSLPELITVLAIVGILAAAATARWDNNAGIDEIGFTDRTLAALRLAQRRALADRCEVRISVSATGIQVDQRTTLCSGGFGLAVAGTAGAGSTLTTTPPAGLSVAASPSVFYFDATGAVRAAPGGALTDVSLSIGARQIQVIGATGHASL